MDVDTTVAPRPEPMTDSIMDNVIEILSSPVGTPMKRKVEECGHREGKENGTKDKKPKSEASSSTPLDKPLVELKGRKLVYKEEPAPWTLPRRRTLQFETDLLEASEGTAPWTEIPSEYHDLVVMAGHEHAAATEAALIKAIKTALCGAPDAKKPDPLPTAVLAPLVTQLFTQHHYGLLPTDFPSTSSAPNAVKIPASLQIRRWEVNEPEKYFAAEDLPAVRTRKVEREKVRAECVRILRDMDDIEARDLVKADREDKKDRKREEVKVANRDSLEQSPRVSIARTSREGTAATNDSRRSASPVKKSKLTPEEEEAKRLKREEREAKQAEKAEKRAAKELEAQKKEEEKAKVEAKKAKQANMFGSFFKAKPKAVEKAAPVAVKTREASPEMSDFHQVFKPHVVRPGTRWAATNHWAASNQSSHASSSTDGWTATDLLRDHMSRHNRKLAAPRTKLPAGIKSGSLHPTVGEVWLAHQEAADPRKVLSQLRKNHKYPWKFLAFDQQARPPYSGTFTKKSASVGPRTPFAQDPVFDYTYDSGDDWEEDEGGEDVDDYGGEAKPDEEEDAENEDDDEEDEFDDWLDDSEDAGYAPMPVDNDDDDPFLHAGPSSRQERLPINPIKKADKPRKIVKVTPWFRGPIWEEEIGKSTELSEYRVQLLNDTPDSFDPFTYTSLEPSQSYKPNMSTVSIGLGTVPCMIGTSAVAAPVVVAPVAPADSTTAGDGTPIAASKSRPAGPKIAFPTTHLNELYTLIHGNSKIQTDLVSQLRQHFESVTSKAAIEAKIKEVAFREGKTKDSKWKVKAEAWTAAGLVPPSEPTPPALFANQPTA